MWEQGQPGWASGIIPTPPPLTHICTLQTTGTGKTHMVRAAAAAASAVLLVLNGADVMAEHYGESEASLRGVFRAASALAPAVVFVDEIDTLAPARGSGGGSASRLVSTLLGEMDRLAGAGVVVVGEW